MSQHNDEHSCWLSRPTAALLKAAAGHSSIFINIYMPLSTSKGVSPEKMFKTGKADPVPLYIPFNPIVGATFHFGKSLPKYTTEIVSCIWSGEGENLSPFPFLIHLSLAPPA